MRRTSKRDPKPNKNQNLSIMNILRASGTTRQRRRTRVLYQGGSGVSGLSAGGGAGGGGGQTLKEPPCTL